MIVAHVGGMMKGGVMGVGKTPLETMQAINHAWTTGQFEGFEGWFREDVVMAMSGFGERVEGRVALVDSYRQFAATATIVEYREGEPMVETFGDTAVVTYSFRIVYEMKGEQYDETGRDLFVLVRSEGVWQAAWRTMLSA